MTLGEWYETNEWANERNESLRHQAEEHAQMVKLGLSSGEPRISVRPLLAALGGALTAIGTWVENQATGAMQPGV